MKKFNTLAKRYVRVKNAVDETMYKIEQVQEENIELKKEVNRLESEKTKLEEYIEKAFEVVRVLFDFPIDSLKRIIDNFIKDR